MILLEDSSPRQRVITSTKRFLELEVMFGLITKPLSSHEKRSEVSGEALGRSFHDVQAAWNIVFLRRLCLSLGCSVTSSETEQYVENQVSSYHADV